MGQYRVHNLWPIPIFHRNFTVKDEWKKQTLEFEYHRMPINNGDISVDKYILDKMPSLKKEIENNCELYVRNYLKVKDNAKFYIQNSWINIHNENEYSQIHHHGGSIFSGVYYPIFPKNSGNISFVKNHLWNNIFHSNIRIEYDDHNNLTGDQYEIEITEGDLVMFPSHLEHRVNSNKSNQKRYSLAFNFFVRGKLGKEEYEQDIK